MRAYSFLYEEVDPTKADLVSVAEWLNAKPDQIEVNIKQEPIDKFLEQIKEMHGTYDEFPKDARRTVKIVKLLKQGATPLPIYVEQGDHSLFVMEGRHRMVAFWQLGMKMIPVAYVSKILSESYDVSEVKFDADTTSDPNFIEIHAMLNGAQIGRVEFQKLHGGRLESAFTFVEPKYRGQGLSKKMYAFARRWGRIVPSSAQSAAGKKLWDKNPDMALESESYQPPTLHTGDKILKGKFKNSPAEIKGFKKDKHNQPVLKTNKGDIQLFKPRVVKLMKEGFDQPYPLQWEKSDYGDYDALAKLPDGTPLSIMFNNQQDEDGDEAVQVEFYRNNSQELTSEGDAHRVFATVLGAIQQYLKEHKPLRLTFSASKEVEDGQNSESRAKLYDRLVQRYAKTWGYRAFRAVTSTLVVYELSRLKNTNP